MKEAGVLPNMVMVFGQMNEPPGSRFRVGLAALTMAEYFRDDEHRDVLLLIDNIFRFIQAGMEVSGLMGRCRRAWAISRRWAPSCRVGGAHRQHRYRRHHLHSGGLCAGGRFDRPGGGAHVLASFRVHRALAQAGERRDFTRPSICCNPIPRWPRRHRRRTALPPGAGNPARRSRNTRNSRTSSPCSAGATFAGGPQRGRPRPRLERFLTQPFFATEQFSGIKGKLVSLKDSLDGCERILRDEFKDYPESALYMIGAIDEAKEKSGPNTGVKACQGQARKALRPKQAKSQSRPKPPKPPSLPLNPLRCPRPSPRRTTEGRPRRNLNRRSNMPAVAHES
jgi:F-type H+/Na+-transporting ATPase subunit beta